MLISFFSFASSFSSIFDCIDFSWNDNNSESSEESSTPTESEFLGFFFFSFLSGLLYIFTICLFQFPFTLFPSPFFGNAGDKKKKKKKKRERDEETPVKSSVLSSPESEPTLKRVKTPGKESQISLSSPPDSSLSSDKKKKKKKKTAGKEE